MFSEDETYVAGCFKIQMNGPYTVFVVGWFGFFETGSPCVTQVGLKLAILLLPQC
jgi:hypothetical protein